MTPWLFLILAYNIAIVHSEAGCFDDPLFKDFCTRDICHFSAAEEYCPRTCEKCNNEARTGFSISNVEDGTKCSAHVAQVMACDHECIVQMQRPVCLCREGFKVSVSDSAKCSDINECAKQNICEKWQTCQNSPGGYSCIDGVNISCGMSSRSSTSYDTCGKLMTGGSFPSFFSNVKSTIHWPWIVIILGFNRSDGTVHKCVGTIIADNTWVLTDGICMKGLKATDIKVFHPSINEHLTVHYLLNDFEHDVTIISIKETTSIAPVCMPEGESFSVTSKCVSISASSGKELLLNTEIISSSSTTCNTFKQNFEQLNRFDMGRTVCTGSSHYDSQCKLSQQSSLMFCRRCNNCQWAFAGIQRFQAVCPNAEPTNGFVEMESAEQWIRNIAPYTYSHRYGSCNDGKCCTKVKVTGSDENFGELTRVGKDQYMNQNGFNLKRVSRSGFNGWTIENKFKTIIFAAEYGSNVCINDVRAWTKINKLNPSRSSKIEKGLRVECSNKAVATWTSWSEWSECTCRFGGKYRERTCKNGLSSADCIGDEIESRPCLDLQCSSCCGEVRLYLPHYHPEQKLVPKSDRSQTFYLTEETAQDRPIYRAVDGRSYLRSYATFWVISEKLSDMNFMFFIEDLASCPNFVSQTGWDYLSGNANFPDNRIRVDCVQRKIKVINPEPEIQQSTGSSNPKTGCCRQVNLITPFVQSDQLLQDVAAIYTYDNELSIGDNYVYINSKGHTLKKIGSTMWGVSLEKSHSQFKLYVDKQPKCPEDISSKQGIWKYFNGRTTSWQNNGDISINCAAEQKITLEPITTLAPAVPTTIDGCCASITVSNAPSMTGGNTFNKDSSKSGMYYQNTQSTLHYVEQHKMWVLATDYDMAKSRCYQTHHQNNADTCPEEHIGVFKCMEGGTWRAQPALKITCNAPVVTTPRQTTRPPTTKITTRATTRATTTVTTKTTIPDVPSNQCCKRIIVSDHGISRVGDLTLEINDNYFDGSHYSSDTKYTLFWVEQGSYWSLGESFNYARSACYVLQKDYAENPCIEKNELLFNCLSPAKSWAINSNLKVKCDDTVATTKATTTTTTKRTTIKATTTQTTKPKTFKPVILPKTTTTASTRLITQTIEVAQCYERDGCCCIIDVVDSDSIATGRYVREPVSSEYYSADSNLYLSDQDTFWTISTKSNNQLDHKFYATKGTENCPQNAAAGTKWFVNQNAWVPTSISFSCWNKHAQPTVQTPIASTMKQNMTPNQTPPMRQTLTNAPAPIVLEQYEKTEDELDYEMVEPTEVSTTTYYYDDYEYTTHPATAEPVTINTEPWMPWSQCSASCSGVQTRRRFEKDTFQQTRPCGNQCPYFSNWFNWSPCSEWCGIGKRFRKRLCVLDGMVNDGCDGNRYENQACFQADCPIVDEIYNCCQVLSVTSTPLSPLDGAYFITDTDRNGNIKYKHDSAEWFMYKSNGQWTIGSEIDSIDAINEIILTYHGRRGRSHCPTGVNKWFFGKDNGKGYLEKKVANVAVSCGTSWSNWSDCDQSNCGDSFIHRTRIDNKGKFIKETKNCGSPCDYCQRQNTGTSCQLYERSGYCTKESMNAFMRTYCPQTCCYFTHDLSYT